jgi:hypothetical protein
MPAASSAGHDEVAGGVPSGLVEPQHGLRALGDGGGYRMVDAGHMMAAATALGASPSSLLRGWEPPKPQGRVPQNMLKFGVGVMLSAFGVFWTVKNWESHGQPATLPFLASSSSSCSQGC